MIEVRQEDREAGQDLYLCYPYQTVPGYLDDLIAGRRDDDALIQIAATIRQQAEDAMKERCAVIADQHRAGRLLAKDDAAKRKACSEARDHESMAIEAMHIATAIRNTDAGGEGK